MEAVQRRVPEVAEPRQAAVRQLQALQVAAEPGPVVVAVPGEEQ